MKQKTLMDIPGVGSEVLPPVSLIVPAYEEEDTIVSSVKALLQLEYPEFEIIVVNDGSTDNTMQILTENFGLRVYPEAYRKRIQTRPVRNFYRSTSVKNIRVINKYNGGKSDAINAGLNVSRYPLVCVVDADSILQRDSLERVVQPFIFDDRTVACGGSVRIVNGCEVKNGYIVVPRAPKGILPLIQIIEYLRAFLFGRLGWSPINALLIISGAFGLFHKETLISIGGYRTDTVGEDMEVIIRMHRILREQKKSYRISFVPDPICWTTAPEKLKDLAHQRIRWQRGLCESLFMNISLLFNPRAGFVGMLAFPYMFIFELVGPVIEVFGIIIISLGFWYGYISFDVFLILLFVSIIFGMLLSLSALLLEEISFHMYQRPKELLRLFLVAIFENFGYRQFISLCRFVGLAGWVLGTKQKWVRMGRSSKVIQQTK